MRLISEQTWAVLTLLGEARGESYEGKVAVGEVIRERMRRKYFSDGTASGTVLRPLQFSCWNHSDPNRIVMARANDSDPIIHECTKAWLESLTSNLTDRAVLYCNLAILSARPAWAKPEKLCAKIDSHSFFKD